MGLVDYLRGRDYQHLMMRKCCVDFTDKTCFEKLVQ
jgi:hypothetical protein